MLREAVRTARIIGVSGWLLSAAAGCASNLPSAPATYVVQPRDTLYSIAWRHDLDYRDLARWNHIGPEYRIAVGQVLVLEGDRGGRPAASRAASRNAPAGAAGTVPAPEPSGAPSLGQPCGEEQPERWTWPTAHVSAPRPVPGGGILLLGKIGQPIHAACGGRVVYAGGGIRGYGNLIIIKHGPTVLSAYAHTIDLSVHEGQVVQAGESIAHMGTGPHRIAALYFEIRLGGRPVDPLQFLPR